MVNKKISELDPAGTITGTETIPLLQAGTTKAATAAQLFASVLGANPPAALDTLKELADAIGDDPNYATSLVTTLAGKTPAMTATGVKTAAYTAAANEIIPADATVGTVPIALPTRPADRTRVTVKKIDASSNTVTVAAAGGDVFNKTGGSTTATLTLLNQSTTVQYMAGTGIWYVVASDTPLTQLDGRYTTPAAVAASYATLGQTAFALMSRLDAGLESASMVVFGDSTGDETTVQNRWVLRTAQWLAARYPAYTVNFHQWNIGTDLSAVGSWDPLGTGQSRTLHVGTGTANAGGPYVLDIWSASASGSQPAYALDSTRWPVMTGSGTITVNPDLVIINHGHNSGGAPGSQFRLLLLQLTRAIEALWPQASIAVTAQNPTGLTFTDHTLDNLRARSVSTTAATEGYGLINVLQTFLNNPTYETDWINPADHLHPSDAGSAVWASLVTQQLSTSVQTTPRAQQNKATQLWVPASAFTPYTTGMTATATFGLTGDTAGMLAFPTAQASSAVADISLPQHWTTFDVFLAWCVASTTGKTASTVVSWRLLRQQFLPPKSYPVPVTGAATQPLGAWVDPGVQTRNASNGAAYQTLLSRISQSSALAERVSAFRIQRSGNNGTDNIAETAYVRGLLFVQAT